MTAVGDIWDRLARTGDRETKEEGWYLRRVHPEAACGVFLALREPGAVPALLIEVDATAVGFVGEYPSARGFNVYPESVTPGPRGRTRLCLVLGDTRYRDVLEVLASDVSQRVSVAPSEDEGVKAFIARLHVWQNFMKMHGIDGLTQEAQVGLFGELRFFSDHLLERVPAHDAVDAWKGPAGGNQDFDLLGRCVEIKSTTVIPPVSVNIASMTQLDERPVELLLLCHVSLVVDGGEGESLPELVERVRETIKFQDASALDGLNAKLIEAGYLDAHSELYSNRRYKHRQTKFFTVRNGFPRVTPGDLREGIADCSYTVVLAACAPYEVESDEVMAALFKESSEIGT